MDSNNLPKTKTYLTGHDEATGKAVVHSNYPIPMQAYDNDLMAMGVVYTTSFPASLTDNADVKEHEALMAGGKLGLVNPNGTVCRTVDFSPGYVNYDERGHDCYDGLTRHRYECLMHRTQSLDFGIILEGTIEMVLDSGETQLMHRGDVAVQRATMHAWRNASKTEWARMIFVLQDCQKPMIGGKDLGEDLGRG